MNTSGIKMTSNCGEDVVRRHNTCIFFLVEDVDEYIRSQADL